MLLPPFDMFPILRGERVVLREVQPSDCRDIVSISFYNGKPAASTDEAAAMLERIDNDYRNGETVHWGIADPLSNTLLGTCGYYRGFSSDSGELGCVLLQDSRGKGIMTEALQLAIAFGIDVLGLKRITAITTADNSKAIALLERLNFVEVHRRDSGLEFEFLCFSIT